MYTPERTQAYDVVITGSGINGVGIARDAACRGSKVPLCERGSLAEQTSSRSTERIRDRLCYQLRR